MALLEGITVVALEQAVAAPLATRHLADWGARVIKIERPGDGDFARSYDTTVNGLSSHFVWLNRSKQSLTLDVKQSAGKDVLNKLLESADVFIQNLAPGAVDRLGFGFDILQSRYPALVMCDISGFGKSGPYQKKKAYDLLIQAETGMLSVTGTDETPSKSGISVADIAAGMYAYSGILAALLRKKDTGRGGIVTTSLFDGMAEWMSYPLYFAGYGGTPPDRTGAHHATIAPYGPVTAGDGRTVMIGLQNAREWKNFCTSVLRRPELSSDSRFSSNPLRAQNRDALNKIMAEEFSEIDSTELIKRLEEGNIACARMNTMQELFEHKHLAHRNRWQEVDSPAGPVNVLLPPVSISDEKPCMSAVPGVGEHSEQILSSLGYDQPAIARFRQQGVI